MKVKMFFAALFLMGFTLTMQAQTATPKVTKTQVKQQKRIKQGVKSGELTKKEAVKLEVQQKHIQKTKKQAKADGVVTRKEKRQLKRQQKRADNNIKHQKHDAQKRN